ncbi:MAG: Copper-sensing transcriptional repressor CsoR [Pelotomaculum sp. PtaB.Bin104]|nr:MAG: Copper-sensing transcriptional repressor CsoR [Pelotomaculum sp. PtaB.Bin104]
MKSSSGRSENQPQNSVVEARPPEHPFVDQHQLLQGEVLTRLKKIEGQVRGVYKMIESGRSCSEIVIQLAAIRSAVNRVGATVLTCHMAEIIENNTKDNKDIHASLNEFMDVFKKFS